MDDFYQTWTVVCKAVHRNIFHIFIVSEQSFMSKETTQWYILDLEPPNFRSEIQPSNHYTIAPTKLIHLHLRQLHASGFRTPNLWGADYEELILDNNLAISLRKNLSLLLVNDSFQFIGDLNDVNSATSPAIPVNVPTMSRVRTVWNKKTWQK